MLFYSRKIGVNLQIITCAISKPSVGDKTIVVLVNRDDYDDHNHWDAPASQRELEHVARYVAIEDLHEGQVHVHGLESHPGEGDQQEIVKEPGGGDAEAHSLWVERQPRVHQEDQIKKQQGQAQLDEDFRWNVLTQLPSGSDRSNVQLALENYLEFLLLLLGIFGLQENVKYNFSLSLTQRTGK